MTETTTTPETGVGEADTAPEAQSDSIAENEEMAPEDTGEEGSDESEADSFDPEDESEDEGENEDGLIDIEFEGNNYQIPAALKNAFLRNADYTRKTQALAEHRRALEGERQSLARNQAEVEQHLGTYAQLKILGDQIARYEHMDWAAIAQSNPQLAQQAFQGLAQLKQLGGSLAAQLQHKKLQQAVGAEREHASRLEQGRAVLAREIPDWSPELGGKLVDFAVSAFGFAPEEVGAVMDPRMIKVLHTAWRANREGENAARVKAIQASQATRPVTEVRAGAGTQPKDPSRMSHAEYRKWRNRGAG